VAFTAVAGFAFILFAIAAGLAGIAAVLDLGVVIGLSLTHDWVAGAAAAWDVDGTSWGSASSAQNKTRSLVIITVPIINPSHAVGSRALEGNRGGVQEVLNVNVSKVESEGFTDGTSLATRNWSVDNNQFASLMRADIEAALTMVFVMFMVLVMVMMFVMIMMLLFSINTDGT